MILLGLGVALWACSHLMKRATPDLRRRLGDPAGKIVAALLSLAAIVLMVIGYRAAPFVALWQPPGFLQHVNNLLMVIAVILINLGYSRGVMRGWLRHPMLTSVMVWSVAHLLVNGDAASVLLFGGIGLWAVVDVALINRMEPAWVAPPPGPVRNDLIYLAASAAVFAAIAALHTWLGYNPFG